MNKNTIITAVIFLVIGCIVGVGITKAMTNKATPKTSNTSSTTKTPTPTNTMTHDMSSGSSSTNSQMSGTMEAMTANLKDKTGSEFDQAFIQGMIQHHEGAIEMANLALKNAQRQEIKDLAQEIMLAQTKEIKQMKQWQMDWFNK